jgi:hypothetical protein
MRALGGGVGRPLRADLDCALNEGDVGETMRPADLGLVGGVAEGRS